MASTVSTTNASDWNRERLFADIWAPLQAVEANLKLELHSRWPEVDELVRYGVLLGGKRLRPALLLLAGQATGILNDDHRVLGTVVEMIHTATLIHDDVIDEADTRRHLATVNSRWDNQASVLLGDFLFTHAFYLASTVTSPIACRWIGAATNRVCEGELRQKTLRRRWEITEGEYFEVIEAKTAELCAVSCRLGAHFAKATNAQADTLAEYGRSLGMAFQISDDLLDVLGSQAITGKSLGTDLHQQRPTLPVLRGLQMSSPRQGQLLRELLQTIGSQEEPCELPVGCLEEIRAILLNTGAIQSTRETAREFAQRAASLAESLDRSPAQATLIQLAHYLVDRQQ